jgi:O-phosphoseryl-tRNA(Cys) synthetase
MQKGKKIINRFDDMRNIASNRLEDWLEEDEDINQNLDVKQKSFYNDDRKSRSFIDNKEDDPWI